MKRKSVVAFCFLSAALASLVASAEIVEPTDHTSLAIRFWRGTASSALIRSAGGADIVFDGATTAGVYWRGQKPNPANGIVPYAAVSFFTNSLVVNAYAITEIPTSSGRQPGCAPKEWKFFGAKSPDSDWVLLDERSSVTDWQSSNTASDTKTFTFANTIAYSCYRIEFYANCGSDYLEIAELALLHAEDTGVLEVQSAIQVEPNQGKVPYAGFRCASGESVGFDLDSTVYVDQETGARYDLAGWTLTDYAGNVIRSGTGIDGLHPFSFTSEGSFARLTLNWVDQRFEANWSSLTDITVPANAAKNAISETSGWYKGPGSEMFNNNKTDNGFRVNSDVADNSVTYEFKTGREVVTGLLFTPYSTKPDDRYWFEGSQTGEDGDWTVLTAANFTAADAFGQPASFGLPIFFENTDAYSFYRLHLTVKTTHGGLREVEFYSNKSDDMLEVFGEPNAFGSPEPLYGITTGHAAGETVTCLAPSEKIAAGEGVRSACVGGVVKSDGASMTNLTTSFSFEFGGKYTTLTWLWASEYEQAVSVQGAGAVDVPGGSVWAAAGGTVTLTATPGEESVFAYWTGDVPEGCSKMNPLVYEADGPRKLTAVFTSPMYVSPTGDDANDGSSWEKAVASPVTALAKGAIKVYLAAGEYVVPGDALELLRGETLAGMGAPEQTRVRVDPELPGTVLRVASADALVRNLTLEGGVSSDGFAAGLVLESGTATNLIVRGNQATATGSLGGGVYLGEGAAFADSVVTNNVSAGNGGGVYFVGSARFENSLIANNAAQNGGGIANSHVMGGDIAGLRLVGNEASAFGGGAYFGAVVSVSNCVATANKSLAASVEDGGGGFFFAGSGVSALFDSAATNNTSVGCGGGVGVGTGVSIDMRDCVLRGNSVTGANRGGGIELYGAQAAVIERCVISDNSCRSSGGGAVADNATFRNCLISGNSSGGDSMGNGGGGVFVHLGSCLFDNCTITKNTCSAGVGAGVSLRKAKGSVTLRNCIVWGNDNSRTTDLDFDETVVSSCVGGYAGTSESVITADPKLTKDFRLKASSPCVNQGGNLSYTADSLDLAREPRIRVFANPKHNVCDIGCYESPYFGPYGLAIFLK